jgi:Spy/CpxP family protein refolding chaperone
MNARRYFVLTLLGAALFATSAVQAQEAGQAPQGEQGMHQLPQSAEKIARHQAKAMQKAVDLNEKQYDKIYSLYLKEENARRKQMTSQGGGAGMPQGGRPQGGPGGGGPMGGGPGMGGPGGGGMMGGGPGMGGGPQGGPGMGGGRPQMSQNDAKTLEKQRQKREKKIKKILTAEQYEKWTSLQPAPGEGMPPQDGMRPGEGMPPRGEMPPMQQQDNVNE